MKIHKKVGAPERVLEFEIFSREKRAQEVFAASLYCDADAMMTSVFLSTYLSMYFFLVTKSDASLRKRIGKS